jgi:hypothetical protein
VAAIKAVTDKLDTAVELDGAVYRFTTNALEQAPTGGGASAADIADAVWNEASTGHTDAGKAGAHLWTNIDAILQDTGTTLDNRLITIDSIVDDIIAEIGAAGVALTAIPWNAAWDAEVQSEVADALAVYDPPTNAEMEARTIAAANYATASALDAVDNFVDTEVAAIKAVTDKLDTAVELDGAVYRFTTNALEQSPTGGSAPTVEQIRAEMDSNSTQLAAIVADTGELQADLTNGGRLDLLIDAILEDTGTTLPATLTTIDDFLDTEVAAILADTNELQTDLTNGGRLDLLIDAILADTGTDGVVVAEASKTGYSLTAAERNNIADALLKRDWTGLTGEAARSMLNALRFLRNKWSVSAGTLTVCKEDDGTSAWTAVVTSASGNPTTGVDPA